VGSEGGRQGGEPTDGGVTLASVRDALNDAERERRAETPPGLPQPLELGPQAPPSDPRLWRPDVAGELDKDEGYREALQLVGRLEPPVREP
jgi:hypothetical protein